MCWWFVIIIIYVAIVVVAKCDDEVGDDIFWMIGEMSGRERSWREGMECELRWV